MSASEAAPLEEMRATDIPDAQLFRYMRVDPDWADEVELEQIRQIYRGALAYVLESYGLDEEEADRCPDVAWAVLIVARDLYDNRDVNMNGFSANKTVQAILAAHDMNLL